MKRLAFLVLILIFSACATSREAVWKTVPEVDIPYERAWTIVVNAVGERFDLETIDAQSGYLRSGWKISGRASFWQAGLLGAGEPTQRTRIVARVEERKPFKIKIKVEKQEPSGDGWVDAGNDEKMEKEIMEDLLGRLRRL